jgi:nucleotide-binding universal stress UspA family protein
VSSIVGEIIGFADKEKVDLTILGTRGRTGFKKLLLGRGCGYPFILSCNGS